MGRVGRVGPVGRVWGQALNELSSWTSLFAFDKQRLLAANVINGGAGGWLGGWRVLVASTAIA